MLTKAEIIEDTVRFYEEDPSRRATIAWRCVYLTEDGRRCAVGRYMLPGCPAESSQAGFLTLLEDYAESDAMRPEAVGHAAEFWVALQNYHDFAAWWVDVKERKKAVTYLWNTWCPGTPMPDFTFHPDPEPEPACVG